jgi:hypothetical protein
MRSSPTGLETRHLTIPREPDARGGAPLAEKNMVSANRSKPVDKQDICRKLIGLLKKSYGTVAMRPELPVLETIIYAICLEDNSPEDADALYARVLNAFHDLNEARVSSISEIQLVFADASDPGWRALRVKNTLQYVFETCYSFDFDSLKRKTLELAGKQLAKIQGLSSFVRSYIMQHCLDSHVLPLDARMQAALAWLSLVDRESSPAHAAEELRPYVRKADAIQFCHLLRCLATDPKRLRTLASEPKAAASDARRDPIASLTQLLKSKGDSAASRTVPRKSGGSKSAAQGGRSAAAREGSRADRSSRGDGGSRRQPKRH